MEKKDNVSKDDSTNDLNRYERIVEFSSTQISRVRSTYVWAASIIGGIFLIGTTAFTFFFFSERKDLNEYYDQKLERLQLSLADEFQLLKKQTLADYEDIEAKIMVRLDKEFEEENVKLLVEKKAKERIDIIADKIIELKINERLLPEIRAFNDSLKLLDIKIQITLANNDSREAWDKIIFYSKHNRFIGSVDISGFIAKKEKDISVEKFSVTGRVQPIISSKRYDPTDKTFDDLVVQLSKTSDNDKDDLIRMIINKSNLSEQEKVRFYIYCLENETSLKSSYAISNALMQKYKFDCKVYDFVEIITRLGSI